eukprot:8901167-Alexandrium_andersonii.AAC.1
MAAGLHHPTLVQWTFRVGGGSKGSQRLSRGITAPEIPPTGTSGTSGLTAGLLSPDPHGRRERPHQGPPIGASGAPDVPVGGVRKR